MKERISITFGSVHPSSIAFILSAWEMIEGSRGDGLSDSTADHKESILRIAIESLPQVIASKKRRDLPTSSLEEILRRTKSHD